MYAAAPLGGYTAGQTLDPDCAPGDTDCVVAITSGGVPAGSNGQVQYNNNGVFGADSLFTRDPSTFNTYIGKETTTPLYQYVVDLGFLIADHPYTGTFEIGETVIGDISGASAVIQNIDSPITIGAVSGVFQDGETVTGQTSGATTLYNVDGVGIQSGDNIMILGINPITFKGLGTVISATTTQATIETTIALQPADFMVTVVNNTFTNASNSVSAIISQNQTGTVNGSMNLSIGNTVDIFGGLFTATGSTLSSSSNPDRAAQLFLGNSNTVGWNDAFILSSYDKISNLGASILGVGNTFAGTSTLQLGVGDIGGINQVPGFTISLDRNNTDSNMTFSTDTGRLGYFKNNGSIGLGYESNPDGDKSFAIGYNVRSQTYGETSLGLWNSSASYSPSSQTTFDSVDRLLNIGNGTGSGSEHNAYTMWKDGSFAYNDDNFQNDDPGTEQNMFYFNYGNHDGLGVAQTKRAIRLGSTINDEWDINSANVGDRSVAIGFDLSTLDPSLATAVASGSGAVAFQSGQATGVLSTAFQLGTASGEVSMVWGGFEWGQTIAGGG